MDTNIAKVTTEELYRNYFDKNLKPEGDSVSVLFNMVASVDGVTTIPSGKGTSSEQGLGHLVDKNLMMVLRAHADCILNGADTLRISGTSSKVDKFAPALEYRKEKGLKEAPIAAVLTSKADFEKEDFEKPFFVDNTFDSVLFVANKIDTEKMSRIKSRAKKANLRIVELGNPNDIDQMILVLKRDYDVKTLLCEGGASVNGSLIKAGYGDHFFLTISPVIAIGSPQSKNVVFGAETLTRDKLLKLKLVSSYYVDDFGGEFIHWQFLKS